MKTRKRMHTITRALSVGFGLAATSYAAYAALAWARYGHPRRPDSEEQGSMLDKFMAVYEVTERHAVRVAAPSAVTFSAACDMDLEESAITRGIFRARELFLRSRPTKVVHVRGLIAQTKALGWGVLAEDTGRQIVMGAVTQPWTANPVFRSLPSDAFASFHEPGYVKIVWNLRADPIGVGESIFQTETRVATTDATARAKFRLYWSFASPGIWLIRRMLLGPLKREAEHRFRAATR